VTAFRHHVLRTTTRADKLLRASILETIGETPVAVVAGGVTGVTDARILTPVTGQPVNRVQPVAAVARAYVATAALGTRGGNAAITGADRITGVRGARV
jgi:hypothetical protein